MTSNPTGFAVCDDSIRYSSNSRYEEIGSNFEPQLESPVQIEKDEEPPAAQPRKKKEYHYVKKHYIDPTSGFFYILGSSLVHFSMAITFIFVKWPDPTQAMELNKVEETGKQSCHTTALDLEILSYQLLYGHAFLCFVNFYREVKESKIDILSQVMKPVEILSILGYLFLITRSMQEVMKYFLFDDLKSQYIEGLLISVDELPNCLMAKNKVQVVCGNVP